MTKHHVLVLAVFFSIGICSASALEFLATINGKSFFAEPEIKTWTDAKARCAQGGMHLAVFTSQAELQVVLNAYRQSLNGWYWIGARDANTISQFTWDYNNGFVSSSVVNPIRYLNGILTCVNMYYGGTTAVRFDAETCSSRYGSICQLVHGKSSNKFQDVHNGLHEMLAFEPNKELKLYQ